MHTTLQSDQTIFPQLYKDFKRWYIYFYSSCLYRSSVRSTTCIKAISSVAGGRKLLRKLLSIYKTNSKCTLPQRTGLKGEGNEKQMCRACQVREAIKMIYCSRPSTVVLGVHSCVGRPHLCWPSTVVLAVHSCVGRSLNARISISFLPKSSIETFYTLCSNTHPQSLYIPCTSIPIIFVNKILNIITKFSWDLNFSRQPKCLYMSPDLRRRVIWWLISNISAEETGMGFRHFWCPSARLHDVINVPTTVWLTTLFSAHIRALGEIYSRNILT